MFSDKDNFDDEKEILSRSIDYNRVREILRVESAKSREWLYNAITSDKIKTPSAQDMLISNLFERIGALEITNADLKKHLFELKRG